MEAACRIFGCTMGQIIGPCRKRELFLARAAIVYVAREQGRTFGMIGRQMGGRDHKTIINAYQQAQNWASRDQLYRARLSLLQSTFQDTRRAA